MYRVLIISSLIYPQRLWSCSRRVTRVIPLPVVIHHRVRFYTSETPLCKTERRKPQCRPGVSCRSNTSRQNTTGTRTGGNRIPSGNTIVARGHDDTGGRITKHGNNAAVHCQLSSRFVITAVTRRLSLIRPYVGTPFAPFVRLNGACNAIPSRDTTSVWTRRATHHNSSRRRTSRDVVYTERARTSPPHFYRCVHERRQHDVPTFIIVLSLEHLLRLSPFSHTRHRCCSGRPAVVFPFRWQKYRKRR